MRFSILIPAYKSRYLKECIQSVLNQTFQDFEVIVVDDHSPECLSNIINVFEDRRLHYFKNQINCGSVNVVNNWNNCLNHSKGEYVICMGDDDVLDVNCLMEYNSLTEKYPNTDVFHCRSYIIDEYSNKVSLTPSWPLYEDVYENIWHRIMGHREHFIGDFVFRREPLASMGGFYFLPMAWGADDITTYLLSKRTGIVHTNKPLFYYRRSDITLSISGDAEVKLEAIRGEENWLNEFLASSYSEEERLIVLMADLVRELPHYFKIKRLHTIAYNGLNGNLMRRVVYWWKNRELTNLSVSELLYAVVLNLKYRKVHSLGK